MKPKVNCQDSDKVLFKKGDIIILNCHISYSKDPQLNEMCIVQDVDLSDDHSVYLEGYNNFYPRQLFALLKSSSN